MQQHKGCKLLCPLIKMSPVLGLHNKDVTETKKAQKEDMQQIATAVILQEISLQGLNMLIYVSARPKSITKTNLKKLFKKWLYMWISTSTILKTLNQLF